MLYNGFEETINEDRLLIDSLLLLQYLNSRHKQAKLILLT